MFPWVSSSFSGFPPKTLQELKNTLPPLCECAYVVLCKGLASHPYKFPPYTKRSHDRLRIQPSPHQDNAVTTTNGLTSTTHYTSHMMYSIQSISVFFNGYEQMD